MARGPIDDEYRDAGRSVVVIAARVLVLSEVAATILDCVPEQAEVDVEDVVHAVISAHGLPPGAADARDAITEQLHDLAAHNLVTLDDEFYEETRLTDEAVLRLLHGAVGATTLAPAVARRWHLGAAVPTSAFYAIAKRHRVISQLASHDEHLAFPPALRARLRASHVEMVAANAPVADDLIQVLDLLEARGVRVLVVKGFALAAQAWGDHLVRGYGDLDLLVHPDDLDETALCLVHARWQVPPSYPAPGTSWGWQQFMRTHHELTLVRSSTSIDLHWHLGPVRRALPDFNTLWSRRATIQIASHDVATLGPFDAFAHSASHSARDGWRWVRGIADVHRLMCMPSTWADMNRELSRDQLTTIGVAARLLGLPPGSHPITRHAATMVDDRTLRRALRAQLGQEHPGQRTTGLPMLTTFRAVVSLGKSGASLEDLIRRLIADLLPPWALARCTSSRATVALSQAAFHRAHEFVGRRVGRAARR
ncbi:nucleotidyltransferase family protein [Nocardioides pini]|uniref:nucleotidyltransferase family protein n=1 Tax=Nocardioides pini TaxID=2975053 RepID=UPI00227BB24A|nr:nucleotidyltransferase family protein [Nocardioides pini]